MDPRIAAELTAYDRTDAEFVDAMFQLVLRREPDPEASERVLTKLADGTLSRATLVHELTGSEESERVRQLDDAVVLGLGARQRRERIRWLPAPPATDERVVEIPWVLSRLRTEGRLLEVGYAYAEPAYLGGLLRAGVELVGVDLATRDIEGMETVVADVRELPFADESFDQILLVSTLEHVGADNTVYGLGAEADAGSRHAALRELGRVLRRGGSLLVTVPLGEPGDHGWFRQEDEPGWTTLFAEAGFFVEEIEAYELTGEGWRAAPAFVSDGVRYGERGPGASAVLCVDLSPGRLRRLLTPSGLATTAKRRLRPLRHRARENG